MSVYREKLSDRLFDGIIKVTLVLILIIILYPLIYVVSASFSNPRLVIEGKISLFPKEITLEAYRRILANKDLMNGYQNSILYTTVGTTINLLMTIAGAYPLSKKDFYGKNILIVLYTFTMFFSGGLIPTYFVIKSLGLINKFWVMVLPGAVSAYNMIIMRTFFKTSIPDELTEAAYIDGSSNISTLLRIVLPLSTPIIAVMIIFYGVGHWNAYFNALIYLSDRARYPLQLVLREILILGKIDESAQQDIGSFIELQLLSESQKYSAVIVSSIPVLLLYPFLQRYFTKGIMIGAIKG
jgi:putative aldouronate transport system permease protein